MKSISMSAGTTLALIEGRKTQTRRLGKLKKVNAKPSDWSLLDCVLMDLGGIYGYWAYWSNEYDIREYKQVARWQENEILYVKEPWKLIDEHPIAKDRGGELQVRVQYITDPHTTHKIWFTPERYAELQVLRKADIKPSMFMPREVARSYIEVKDVRVETANEISRQDIIAEGIEVSKSNQSLWRYPTWSHQMKKAFPVPHEAWEWLWNSVNKNCKLNTNPWCWVIDFSTCGNPDA